MTVAHGRNADLAAAIREAEARYTERNPQSRARHEAAAAVMPGGNTRTVLFYPPFPLVIEHGRGCRVRDADGHDYVDFLGEYTAGLYGHSHPVVMAAIERALGGGIVLGGHNMVEAELARAICERFPAIEQLRFTNSGTEANLMAVATARAFTGRPKLMAMHGGYHGGLLYFADPSMPINAPYPMLIGRYNDADQCRDLIRANADSLAAVILEPMLGSAGCVPATKEFLTMLREETARAGALLIFDEVMTSRLGPNGLGARVGVTPDLTTLGKYLGGGLSFGAFGGRADILRLYDPRRADAIPHAGTFNNNILTMSAGLAGLTQVFTPEAATALNDAGEDLRDRLNALARRHGAAMQFTGIGSMIAAHFRDGPIRSFDDVLAGRNEARPLLHLDLLAQGVYAARRGMFVLSLPMGTDEREALVAAVDEFLSTRGSLLHQ